MSKPPSPGQLGILSFFGRTAASSYEAHQTITELLGNPANARAWQAERARRFVAKMDAAVAGAGGHNATFHVACVLMHGFALSQAEALPILSEYNLRCSPPWFERELLYKLNSADRSAHDKPRGHLLGDEPAPLTGRVGNTTTLMKTDAPKPAAVYSPRKLACEFDPEKLKQLAGKWRDVVTGEWLANRSSHDPATIFPTRFLELLYQPGEKVLVFDVFASQGQAFWPSDELPVAGKDGVWFLAQPVNGQSVPNPRTGKMSRRSQESVTAFRYLVLESDKAEMRDWLGLLVQLPLQIDAIYTSGGKSVHALVRVDCRTHEEWENYVRGLMPTLNLLGMAGVDPATLTSVRLTRLPGCMRNGKLQKLLYLRPASPVQKLCDAPELRDVTAEWLAKSNLVLDGHAEPTRELRRGLWYYSKANEACAAAYREICEMGEAKKPAAN